MAYYQLPHVPPASPYRYGADAGPAVPAPPAAPPAALRILAAASLVAGGAVGALATLVPWLFVVALPGGLAVFTLGSVARRRPVTDVRATRVWPAALAVALAGMVIAFAAIAAAGGGDVACRDRSGTRVGVEACRQR